MTESTGRGEGREGMTGTAGAGRPAAGPAATAPVTPHVSLPTTAGGRILALPIIAYRRWMSPALPARCRFYPSCSAYALEAIARHGAIRGAGLAVWRLLRCHPFHPGGYDPVPGTPESRHHADAPGAVK